MSDLWQKKFFIIWRKYKKEKNCVFDTCNFDNQNETLPDFFWMKWVTFALCLSNNTDMELNPSLKKIIRRLNNKFVIASIIFLLWILFFDQNNLLNRLSDLRNLRNMKAQKEYYTKKIANDIQRTKELETDDDNLEKFAREQYLMKKPNEDVFVIVEE